MLVVVFFIIYPRKDNPMNTPAFLKNLIINIDKPIHQAYNVTENQYKLYTPETTNYTNYHLESLL